MKNKIVEKPNDPRLKILINIEGKKPKHMFDWCRSCGEIIIASMASHWEHVKEKHI